MKKLAYILFCLCIPYNFSQASMVQLGPRLGISVSELSTSTSDQSFSFSTQPHSGYQAGLVARFQLPFIYIQPELLITGSGARYQLQGQKENLRYTNVNIPVMLGFGFLGVARLQLGPALNVLLDAKADNQDIKVHYEPISLGYQVGLGTDLGRFMLDLKYEGGLTPFGRKLAGKSIEHKTSLWILSVGYNLL